MAAEDYEKMSASEKKKEDWMNAKWRPMMGWIYMITCITDFILFPVLWSVLQAVMKQPVTPWNPITLQGAGLFHLSMGAIIGIAAFGRTQEKLAGANNGGAAALPASGAPAFGVPAANPAPAAGGFGAPTTGFGAAPAAATPAPGGFGGGFAAAPAPAAAVVTGFGGKPAPAQLPDPVI